MKLHLPLPLRCAVCALFAFTSVAATQSYASTEGSYGLTLASDEDSYIEVEDIVYEKEIRKTALGSTKIKLAKYPAQMEPSYAPAQGIATYVLSIMPASEFNKVQVVTSNEQLNQIMDEIYNSGKKSITLRYEPVDGNVWFGSDKYIFNQNGRVEYNGGKCIYTTLEITGLQVQP